MMTSKSNIDIVYHGYLPMYEPYLAALVHIGITPEVGSYFKLCTAKRQAFGNLMFIGLDDKLNRVYAMGCRGFDSTIINSQNGFRKIYNIESKVCYIDTVKIANYIPRIVHKMGNYPPLNNTAQRLFYYWYKTAYPKVCSFVKQQVHLLREE